MIGTRNTGASIPFTPYCDVFTLNEYDRSTPFRYMRGCFYLLKTRDGLDSRAPSLTDGEHLQER